MLGQEARLSSRRKERRSTVSDWRQLLWATALLLTLGSEEQAEVAGSDCGVFSPTSSAAMRAVSASSLASFLDDAFTSDGHSGTAVGRLALVLIRLAIAAAWMATSRVVELEEAEARLPGLQADLAGQRGAALVGGAVGGRHRHH